MKCVRLGLPAFFSASGDIYEEAVYLLSIQVIIKDESVFDQTPKRVEGKDINQILKNCFDILSSLKIAFKPKNPPQYARGAELSLAATSAEEYRYPLGKEWNLLTACIKVHKHRTVDPQAKITPQQGESSSGKKHTAVKTVLSHQQLIVLPNTSLQHAPASPLPPLSPPHPAELQQSTHLLQQPFRFTLPSHPVPSSQPEGLQ